MGKRCTHCLATKPLGEFYRCDHTRDKRQSWCKACTKEEANLRKRAHPGKARAAIAAWRANNREKDLANKRRWHHENAAKHNAMNMKWAREHPERMKSNNARRRAKSLRATPSWANKFFIDEIYRLAALRTKVTGIEWEVDHIIPLRNPLVCGLHWEGNMQVIPASQNNLKGNRLLGCYTGA